MFCAVKLTRKQAFYNIYGKAFDGATSWSFGNYFAESIVIFGVDDSLLRHSDNLKKNFLVLGKGKTDDISDSVGSP